MRRRLRFFMRPVVLFETRRECVRGWRCKWQCGQEKIYEAALEAIGVVEIFLRIGRYEDVTTFFNTLLDHLIKHCGRTAGFALFGFFFSSMLLLPCTYLQLISTRAALIEVASSTAWMVAASMVLLVVTGGQDQDREE